MAPPIQKDYDRFTMVYPLKIRICQIAFAGSINIYIYIHTYSHCITPHWTNPNGGYHWMPVEVGHLADDKKNKKNLNRWKLLSVSVVSVVHVCMLILRISQIKWSWTLRNTHRPLSRAKSFWRWRERSPGLTIFRNFRICQHGDREGHDCLPGKHEWSMGALAGYATWHGRARKLKPDSTCSNIENRWI